ncbi:MAG: LysR family transcriptional regulator [Candidatus Coproplasma sp.]
MTLQQLKYAICVAEQGKIASAAKLLFISQPSLTQAVRELEEELDINIFNRTNRGVELSAEGEEFLAYARQVVEQANLLEEKYKGAKPRIRSFCVSCQHYSFAVDAFVSLIKEVGAEEYDFSLRETQTYEIIDDVARLKSEVGVLYKNAFNRAVIEKVLKSNDLKFTPLFTALPHVFVGKDNPLAKKQKVTLDDLKDYPCLTFEQGEHNSFYFSEEILSTRYTPKNIRVRDRATLFNCLVGLNGYTISSGIINGELNWNNVVSVPLEADDCMEIGYVTNDKTYPSALAARYIELLKNLTQEYGRIQSDK